MKKGKQVKSSELRALMARRLRAARMAYKENGAEVARDLGVTPQVLNAYEKGRNFPDEHFMLRFCDLTGCPMDWVLRGQMETKMSAKMAARIAHFDLGLVPDLPELSREDTGTSQEAVVGADA